MSFNKIDSSQRMAQFQYKKTVESVRDANQFKEQKDSFEINIGGDNINIRENF